MLNLAREGDLLLCIVIVLIIPECGEKMIHSIVFNLIGPLMGVQDLG